MAEKNLIDPSASADLTPTSDYISHHLTNLTYGWCEKTQSWGFANHQQSLFSESSCKVTEMGFWAFHLVTIFMSTFLGLIFFGFFGLVLMGAKKGVPGKVQNFAEFVFEFISGAVKSNFHGTSKIIGPLAFASCVWILSWNLMDLLPVEMTNFFGANLVPLWANEGELGSAWGPLKSLWGHFGTILKLLGEHISHMMVTLGPFSITLESL